VVRRRSPERVDLASLDLGYLGQFVGQRINDLVLEKLAAEGYGDLRVSHGYVVQHLLAGPRTVTELARLLGVSQQAASKTVAELVELGYLDTAATEDRRARAISLSKRALASVAIARKFRAKLEKRLVTRHGPAVEKARILLARVLEDLGGADIVRTRSVREPR
jgi:DNA-binding MarR family transcriptional regulator